ETGTTLSLITFIIFFVQRFVRSASRGYQFLITLGGYFMFVNVFVKNTSSESSPLENPTICFDKKCYSINICFLCKVNIIKLLRTFYKKDDLKIYPLYCQVMPN